MPLYAHLPALCLGAFLTVLIPLEAMTAGMQSEETPEHANEEKLPIKSLSEEDIEELKRGGGWGLAKAAELNGYPGPAHLLELKDKIPLDPEQVEKLQTIYDRMTQEAKLEGESFIAYERKLDEEFRTGTVNDGLLQTALGYIEEARRKLRYIHLSAHLEATRIVTSEQIERYNILRGYNVAVDPCVSIPQGHDAAMWRKHNGCE